MRRSSIDSVNPWPLASVRKRFLISGVQRVCKVEVPCSIASCTGRPVIHCPRQTYPALAHASLRKVQHADVRDDLGRSAMSGPDMAGMRFSRDEKGRCELRGTQQLDLNQASEEYGSLFDAT